MKSETLTRAVSCIVLLICFLAGNAENLAQPLRWNLAEGEQFDVKYTQQSNSSTTVTDRSTEIETETELEMSWLVTDIDDQQHARIEQTIKAIRLVVGDPATPDKKISLDTSSNQTPSRISAPILKQVKPLIGLKFVVSMTARGEIKEVSIPEESLQVLQELPGSLSLQSLFSEEGIRELIGAAATVLPEDELSLDESWETESLVDNGFGQFKRIRRFTFSENDPSDNSDSVTLRVSSTMQQIGQAANSEALTLIEFSESGTMTLDLAAGHFLASEMKSTIKTETPYREKKIVTTVKNLTQTSIVKK